MKTYRSLFSKLCSPENLELAFKKARKRKTKKRYVQDFEKNLDKNLNDLHQELIKGTYSPLPLKTFILRDPKTRKISVSNFRDRIVHHAICIILEPIFEKYFIYDSYANRKGKGVLAALKRFDRFKRKVSNNGYQIRKQDDNFVMGFVLKADIKHYFDTVAHKKLIEIISRRINDKQVIAVIKKVIDNHFSKANGRGMPLGNLTSQFFANVYLNELDQFVKHKLKAKYYLRYVDDFVMLHKSKKQLIEWQNQINKFLQKELFLELHQQKSKIRALGQGIDLLGFKCFYYFRILRKRNIRKMLKRIEEFNKNCSEKKVSADGILESFQGWSAYAMHGDSFRLRNRIAEQIQPHWPYCHNH